MKGKQAWCRHAIKDLRVGDLLGSEGYFKHPETGRWRKCTIIRISKLKAGVTYSDNLIKAICWEDIYS